MKMRELTPKLIQEMITQGMKSVVIAEYLKDICLRHKYTAESLRHSNISLEDVGIEVDNPDGEPFLIQQGRFNNFRIVVTLSGFPRVLRFRYMPEEVPPMAA